MSDAALAHNAFCQCGHWRATHAEDILGTLIRGPCGKCACDRFRAKVLCGVVLTPETEQKLYREAMKRE